MKCCIPVSIVVMVVMAANAVYAQSENLLQGQTARAALPFPCTNPTTFDDGFENGAGNWSPLTPSRWQVINNAGSLRYFLNTTNYESPDGILMGEISRLNGRKWEDFTFECSAKSADVIGGSGAADLCVAFAYQDFNSYYYINFNQSAGLTELFRVHDGGIVTLASFGGSTFVDDNYHSIRIERTGSQIRAFFDGAQVLSATDTFFGEGEIGIGSYNDSGFFDDISITGCPSQADLVADRVYLRTGPNSGPEVSNPAAGGQYYIHLDYRNTGTAAANNFQIDLRLNGNAACTYPASSANPNTSRQTWCQAPVTWPSGNNTIEAELDVNKIIVEFNENDNARSQIYGPLIDIAAPLEKAGNSAVAWADFSGNDGYMDAIVIGNNGSAEVSKVYSSNLQGHFTEITTAGLIGVKDGFAIWGDYDNDQPDADLDLLLSGDAAGARVTRLYRYDGSGIFTPITTPALPGVRNGAGAFGDYDNDGDLDILLTGSAATGNLSEIYKNTGGSFSAINAGLTGVAGGSAVAWGDYDNDGDLDIVLAGESGTNNPVTQICQNQNGSFSNLSAPLPGVSAGAVAWGDFDSDGDLDLLLAGRTNTGSRITQVYRNTNGTFSIFTATLPGIESGAAAWGDYDNDGDLDILLAGDSDTGAIAKVYRNNSNTNFVVTDAVLTGVKSGSAAWGDFDKDGDLDILLAGMSSAGRVSIIYRNNSPAANTPPAIPSGLTFSPSGGATLSWNKSTDNETAPNGLTYNLRVGTTPNGTQIISPLSNVLGGALNGFHRVPKIGNANHRTTLTIKNLPVGIYYWSVQAIDNAFAGSAFAQQGIFNVAANRLPVVANAIPNQLLSVGGNSFTRDLNAAPAVFNDPDGDGLTYSANSSASNIAAASISGNTLTVSPIASGSATITVTANDGRGGTVPTTFTVTVTSNRAPMVANAISNQQLTAGGNPFTRDLNAAPAVFNDPDGDALTYSANSSANNIATASVAGNTLTVTPVSGGSATITVTANDNKGGTTPTTFTVTVLTNRPPVVANAILNQNLQAGGAPFTRDLNTSPAVFNDPDGDALSYTASSSATTIATATIAGSTLTVSPVGGGSATITVTANDTRGGSVSMTFTAAVNRAPVVANGIINQIITIGGPAFTRDLNLAPAVFSDPDGEALTYTASSSANGIATASTSGSTLTVTAVSAGNAIITITANDNRGGSVSMTFTATINRAPTIINPIDKQTITLGVNTYTRNLNLVFADPDGDPLAYAASSSAPNIATFSVSANTLTVTPVASGIAIITVTADDRRGGTTSMTFPVTVNQRPVVANAIASQTLTLGGTPFTRNLNASPPIFTDPDDDALTYTANSSAANIATANVVDNTLTVSPVAVGNATITVTADDKSGGIVSTTFTVTVNMTINRAPVIANAIPNQTLKVGGAAFTRDLNAAPVVFTDPDGDALTYTANSSATNIATTNIAGNVLTVSPVDAGNAMITITANDNKGGMVSATFNVTVEPGNRPPAVANAISNQTLTLGGSAFTRNLNASPEVFTDLDGDVLTYNASSSATNIATANVSGSTLTVAPVAVGTAMITVMANDGKNGTVSTTFSVTVGTAPNRAPAVASAIANQTLNVGGTSFTRDLNASPAVFSDPDGDALTYTASSSAANIATVDLSGTAIIVAPVDAGSATITVTANDGKGGSVSTTFVVAVNRNQRPNVTHTAPLSAPRGQNIFIVATVTDDRGIDKVELNYRNGGNMNFTSTQMTPVSGTNNYQAAIPASVVTSRGVEYFIIATDMDNEMTRNPSAANGIFSIQIQVTSETRRDAQGNAVTQPSGSAATAYRLISVPLQLDNPSANAVLEDDLGPYDNTEWRLFGLNPIPAQDLNIKTPYLEFRTGGDLSPGKSLFLIVADPGKMITIDAARSMRTDQEFQIPLQRGHNFIGTPFNFDIPKTKLRLSSGSPVIDLQTYAGSWVTENMKLLTWEGYYLPNNRATADILLVNPNLSSSTAAPMAEKAEAGWRIRLSAHCSEAADTHNFAGVSPASEDGWDDHDLVEAPPIGDYVSLYFPHVEWRKVFERYREDMRSTGNPNQRWRFIVESNIPNAMVTLRFEGLKDIEANLAIFLVDEALKYKQNLREDAVYQYQPRRNEFTKTFTLVVGKEEFVAGQTAGVQGAPENFVLEQNFPNPFNPETAIRFGLPQQSFVTIKIYDLAGREIATLLDRVELPAGRHQRVWDGRDAQGRVVVSGIYFYRLVAGSFITTKKLTLMQ